jgi:hypothetical protein
MVTTGPNRVKETKSSRFWPLTHARDSRLLTAAHSVVSQVLASHNVLQLSVAFVTLCDDTSYFRCRHDD